MAMHWKWGPFEYSRAGKLSVLKIGPVMIYHVGSISLYRIGRKRHIRVKR